MEVRQVWRQAHLKQPLGSRDGSRTRQRGGSGPKSTTGGSRGGSSGMARAGGVCLSVKGVNDGARTSGRNCIPMVHQTAREVSSRCAPVTR